MAAFAGSLPTPLTSAPPPPRAGSRGRDLDRRRRSSTPLRLVGEARARQRISPEPAGRRPAGLSGAIPDGNGDEKRLGRQRRARDGRSLRPQGVPHDLALRVYTTRLLGRDPTLVLHGGGNTSVKTRMPDLLGEEVEVLCIKGSGADMAAIEPAGMPAVRLDRLRKLRARAALSDEDMVRVQRANLLDPDGAQSVGRDAAACLSAAQVRRPHPRHRGPEPGRPAGRRSDLRRAVSTAASASCPTSCRASRSPRRAAEVFEPTPGGRGPDPAQARHLHLRRKCARSLRAHDRTGDARRRAAARQPQGGVRDRRNCRSRWRPPSRSRRSCAAPAASRTRRPKAPGARLDPGIPQRATASSISSTATELARYSQAGVVTPDHTIRTKNWPLIVAAPASRQARGIQRNGTREAVADFVAHYKDYFARNNARVRRHQDHARSAAARGAGAGPRTVRPRPLEKGCAHRRRSRRGRGRDHHRRRGDRPLRVDLRSRHVRHANIGRSNRPSSARPRRSRSPARSRSITGAGGAIGARHRQGVRGSRRRGGAARPR